MRLRINPKNKLAVIIEIDGVNQGTLPRRVLPPSFPEGFEGEADSGETGELLDLLRARAFNLLLDWLAKSEHSTLQCRAYLKRHLFHPSLAEEAIERLRQLNYLSDERFAETLIRSYANRRASRRAIIAKLREQRIPSSLWEPLLAEIYPRQEASSNLRELLARYCASHSELPRNKLREKAFTHFFRKGFELQDIQSAWEALGRPSSG